VKISQVRLPPTRRLGRKLGRVRPEDLDRLVEGLIEIIDGRHRPADRLTLGGPAAK
jgi:hypothetical protein